MKYQKKERVLSPSAASALAQVQQRYASAKADRRALIIQAYKNGASVTEIGEVMGIHRGLIHNIVNGRKNR